MKLALGTVQFGLPYGIANQGGQVSLPEASAILRLAAANGIDTLDTAMAYGESEQRLGEMGVKGWRIVSKLSAIPADCAQPAQWIREAIATTLHKLGVDQLYGLLLHRPAQLLERGGEQIYRALQEVKKTGAVTRIGISVCGPAELDDLCHRFQFDVVQAPFNIIDRRLIDTGWLDRLASSGVELHVRSVFLQGLLLMKQADRAEKFNRWSALWHRWSEWLNDSGLTPQQACLRYPLAFPQIRKVIVGVDSSRQLQELLAASTGPLPNVAADLSTNDAELLNPSHWPSLA